MRRNPRSQIALVARTPNPPSVNHETAHAIQSEGPRAGRDIWPSAALAALTAGLGWSSLAIEFATSIAHSLATGHSLLESLFLYFRFFTILTNIGIAMLMSVSFVRLLSRAPLPAAALFNMGVVYIGVTCGTYEVMLRAQWSPHGMRFFTDAMIHDVIPALTLLFWFGFAPREGTRWRDALWALSYPAAYLASTLVAGRLGEGYPYSFLDANKLGFASVMVVAAIFLAIFYGLALITTGLSISWANARALGEPRSRQTIRGDRSAAV